MKTNKMRINKRSKKAVTFAIGIILVAIAVTIFAFYAALTTSSHRKNDIETPLFLLNVQNEAKEAMFYTQESAKYASQQTLFELLKGVPTKGNCKFFNSVIIWNNNCQPDISKIKNKFLQTFEARFYSYLGKYKSTFPSPDKQTPELYSKVINQDKDYTFNINKNKLEINKKNILSYIFPQGMANPPVTGTYEVDPSFALELPFGLNEIIDIYKASKNAVKDCKSAKEVEKCVKDELDKLNFENFDFGLAEKSNYLIFKATTKKRLFFDSVYGRASFSYAFSLA